MNENWLLQAVMISGGLVLMSFIIIAIAFRHAHRRLRFYHEREEEPQISPFWMEKPLLKIFKVHGFKLYILFSFTLSLVATAASYLLPILVAGPNPWWWTIRPRSIAYEMSSFVLLSFAAVMGFLVPHMLYHYLAYEVLEDMNKKANKTSQPKRIARTLKMFTLVAGGSSLYQAACMFIACALFIVIKLFFVIPRWQQLAGIVGGLDMRPLLTDWAGLLLYALIGGIVGPMATTISAFMIYCGITFEDGDFFDPLAKDERGGFRSLGIIGIWSSFMVAVVPGVAIPILFLAPKPKTIYEVAINMGLLFFLVICVVLFFFVPIYYVHRAMKTSRKPQIQKFEGPYRTKFLEFLKRVEDRKATKMTEILSMLALREIYHDMTGISDWPIDYLAVLKVTASAVLPILSYIIKLLTLG